MKKCLKLLVLAFTASACNSDVADAQIEGRVMDVKTREPIEGVKLMVENWYYQGGDYDSYGGCDTVAAVTDQAGTFRLRFRKSGFVTVDARKAGYQSEVMAKYSSVTPTKFLIHLKKQ